MKKQRNLKWKRIKNPDLDVSDIFDLPDTPSQPSLRSRFSKAFRRIPFLRNTNILADVPPLQIPGAEDLVHYPNTLSEAFKTFGVPFIDEVITPREEAIILLETAAEIEHALMAEYLYTLYSIRRGQKYISGFHKVALEEMGHLMSVQNLLLAVKASPYFARQDASPQPEQDPFPFSLSRLTKTQLAKYVSAEMPALDSITLESDRDLARQIMSEAVSDVGMNINRVGLIYARIYWLFQSSDTPQGPLEFSEEEVKWLKSVGEDRHIKDTDLQAPAILRELQATHNDWGHSATVTILTPVNRSETLEAIHQLLEEGEGHTNSTRSHFSIFFELYKDWDNALKKIHNFPTNPKASTYPPDHIAIPYSELFDIRYEIMLLDFHHWLSFKNNSDELEKRKLFARWAVSEMSTGVKELFDRIAKKRFSDPEHSEKFKCAPYFSLPLEQFPTELSKSIRLMRDLVEKSDQKIAQIQQHADAKEADFVTLSTVSKFDNERIEFEREQNFTGV